MTSTPTVPVFSEDEDDWSLDELLDEGERDRRDIEDDLSPRYGLTIEISRHTLRVILLLTVAFTLMIVGQMILQDVLDYEL